MSKSVRRNPAHFGAINQAQFPALSRLKLESREYELLQHQGHLRKVRRGQRITDRLCFRDGERQRAGYGSKRDAPAVAAELGLLQAPPKSRQNLTRLVRLAPQRLLARPTLVEPGSAAR